MQTAQPLVLSASARKEWVENKIKRIRYEFEGKTIEGIDDLKELKDEERALKRVHADIETRLSEIRRQLAVALSEHNCTQSPMDGCEVCTVIHS